MEKKILLFWLVGLLLLTIDAFSQRKKSVDFSSTEESIKQLFEEIRETRDDSAAIKLHRQIEDILAKTLAIPEAYRHKFDSLGMIGKIYAPKKEFRLMNWNHSSQDGTYRYFAVIVFPGGKEEPNKVVRIIETTDSIIRPDMQILGANQWLGCLYYTIIPKKRGKDGKTYYTLLGLDMHDPKTKKKYVELLSFDANGTPQFGAPIMELNGWPKRRAIFEFSAQHNMYLEYNKFKRQIEMDLLAPPLPFLVGHYEWYEPTLFRDALKFKKGEWKHIKFIKEPKAKKVTKRSLPKPPKPAKPPKRSLRTEPTVVIEEQQEEEQDD